MKPVAVATFSEQEPALRLQQRLENSGIHAHVQSHRAVQRFFSVKRPVASITLEVEGQEYDRACQMLREWDQSEHVLEQAVHCPQCSSPRVEFPQYTRRFVTPAFHVGIAIALGLIPKEFFCTECQYTWPLSEKKEIPRDVLGWPKQEPKSVH